MVPTLDTFGSRSRIPETNLTSGFVKYTIFRFDNFLLKSELFLGVCDTCAAGSQTFWPSATNPSPHLTEPVEAAGTLTPCAMPCVCDAAGQCYEPAPGEMPAITLYPYCDAGDCFVAVFLSSEGSLVTSPGGAPAFNSEAQVDPVSLDVKPVTDPAFPRAASVSCTGCPAVATC